MAAKKMTRREFIAATAASGAAVLAFGTRAALAQDGKSTVVSVCRPQQFEGFQVNAQTVADMVHRAVKRLAGEDDMGAAWGKFVGPDDVVGIKVNALFPGGGTTHVEVVNAVVEGCQAAGVPAERIIVWDRKTSELARAGFPTNRDGPGVRYYGTDGAYEAQTTTLGSFSGRLSEILTKQITALINVPILKSHGIAGMTGVLKNHYGSFHNPQAHHGNYCDPYMADVNGVPAIRDKMRLAVVDALFPIAHGGPRPRPQYTWIHGGILVSTDPVAADYVGLQILERRRQEIGLGPIGNRARHIATAAAKGLGVADPNRIELVELS